ncbi:MAG: HAMP domain-containing histidine kinase [Actinobacteria bacterium]|nr:HAMP domain-containing histidine kinase [Actinomycetota bacterium]
MKPLFRRGPQRAEPDGAEARDALRGRLLIEESREIVVVLDDSRRVVSASRRARESVEGLLEGAPFPDHVPTEGDRAPLEVAYEIGGRRETLLYLGRAGDLAAYEELRAGFTAAVSHELRTPLARLLALLETALLPGSDAAELIERARVEIEQIGELIDDVLFLSELEGGREVVSLGSTRALPVLERVTEELDERATRAGVTLRVACPASFELPIRHRMLEVVAKNLAENAIRYAGPGSTFTLAGREEAGAAVLEGADDGAGVAPGDLPRLFERFYRSDAARASRGTGLGLAIVKHVIGAGGGSVEAAPTPGGGLTVRCALPVAGRRAG